MLRSQDKAMIFAICAIEQWAVISGSVWLIGFEGWSPWLIALSVLMIAASAPSICIKSLEGKQ